MTLSIVEVDDAAGVAGRLFQKTFGHAIPDFPRHFVALHDQGDTLRAVAYVHYSAWDDHAWLCGGVCADREAYQRAEPEEAAEWKRAGGLGEIIMRTTLAKLNDRPAIFAHCGEPRQWQHDLNVGFIPAAPPTTLLVIWKHSLAEREQQNMIDRALALGPF